MMLKKNISSSAVLITAAVAALVFVFGGFGIGCRREPQVRNELHIGYMICNSLPETMSRFAPLNSFLEEVIGRRIIPHYINTIDFEKEIAKGQIMVAHTNSLLYVIFHELHGWRLLAGEREGSHGSRTAGVIIVKSDSPVKALSDLRKKRMIFGPEMAPLGFLSPYYLLLENGVDPELDLAYYAFARGAFSHEKVVWAVLDGAYDAGAAPLLDLENMEREGKLRREDYRILATGEFVPYCTFAVSPALADETRLALEKALLDLTADVTARVGREVLAVLDRAGINGYERLDDDAYDPIRRMARRVNMPPYQRY